MNQDISICVLSENEMGWTEPFELDKVQILDNYYLSAQKSDIAFLKKMDTARLLAGFRTTAGIDTKRSSLIFWRERKRARRGFHGIICIRFLPVL